MLIFFGGSAAGLGSLPLMRPDAERSSTYRILIAQGYNLKSWATSAWKAKATDITVSASQTSR
jgi:hypothetical protein